MRKLSQSNYNSQMYNQRRKSENQDFRMPKDRNQAAYNNIDSKKPDDSNVKLATHQQLIESKVIFNLPPKDAVIELAGINRVVLIDNVDIITDAAITSGYLHMTVVYNTIARKDAKGEKDNKDNKDNKNEKDAKDETSSNNIESDADVSAQEISSSKDQNNNKDNKDNKDNKNGKDQKDQENDKDYFGSFKVKQIEVDGVVRQSNIWIPFEFVIQVPGAKKGDLFQTISAYVEKDAYIQTIIYDEDSDAVLGPMKTPFIIGFFEKDLIKIEIQVS